MPKIDYNGVIREMTAEEVAEWERLAAMMPAKEPDAGVDEAIGILTGRE